MALKQARFYVEPAWFYKGPLVKPIFGSHETCMENIVDWVAECEPEGATCYAIWKVTQQEQRIHALEDIVKSLIDELHAQDSRVKELLQLQETHTVELRRQESMARDLRQFQECQMEELREKIKEEPVMATEMPYAKVVECDCGTVHEGICLRRPFLPSRRPFLSNSFLSTY